jgi:hypothetical protein
MNVRGVLTAAIAALGLFFGGDLALAKGHGSHGSHTTHAHTKGTTKKKHRSDWSKIAKRAKNGRIARSSSARRAFLKSIGIKDGHTPKGYIVDHIKPLAAGGPDVPSNMRLITQAQENAQHSAEVASAKNPSGYNPYKYSGPNGALGTTKHHHHSKP